MPADLPWRPADDGLLLAVRLTPKGGRDAIDGIARRADGRVVLKARVRPAAEDGAANAALRALVADRLRLAASTVTLVSGATSREKTLMIAGDPARLAGALAALVGTDAGTVTK